MTSYAIIGSQGNLSRALQSILNSKDYFLVPKEVYASWIFNKSISEIKQYFENLPLSPDYIVNTIGIIDSHKTEFEINEINTKFPLNLVKALETNNSKIVTFGTIMENFPNYCKSNSYLMSKMNLYNHLNGIDPSFYLHFQIHTWFGGKSLHKQMFLGQIASAIFNNKIFEMTSGEQLREYHHIEDDAQAIKRLLNSNTSGIVQISHGHPIKLATMAIEIFQYFNCVNLLEIGAKDNADNENMMTSFQKETYLNGIHFRNTMDGVISYLSRLLDSYERE